MKKSAKIRQKKNNVPCGTMKRRNEKMCKFTKVTKMLENYGASNYFVQFGEMEIHTTKFYFYMVKVNNGILVKIRQNDMMTYFVDMVVKNQEQAKSIILGYVLESQKYDMEQLKEEMDTPKNDMEKLEFQKMEWFDTMQEEETIIPCETIEEDEEVDTTTQKEKYTKMDIVNYIFNKLEKTHDTKKLMDDIIKIFVDAEKDNFTIIGFDFSEYEKNIIDPILFIKLDMNIPIHKASKKTHKTKRMIYLDDYLLNN